MDAGECDVCGAAAIGVASSTLGAFSFGFCRECLRRRAEPREMVDCTYDACGGECADWFYEIPTFHDGRYVTAREYLNGRAPEPLDCPDGPSDSEADAPHPLDEASDDRG